MDKQFDPAEIKAIIGLGNPGSKYALTRHNIGFRVVDELAVQLNVRFQKQELMEVATASWTINGTVQSIILIKPLTYMNDSGKVIPFLNKKGIKAENILVAHDELEKPFGATNLKFSGSAKGHNGLKSIIGMIGQDFWRLRCGIGRPDNRDDVPDYVLSNFPSSEEQRVSEIIDEALRLIY